MHIYYVTQRDVLKGRVGSIMVMQSCRAFARTGAQVTLVAPTFHRAGNVNNENVWKHYGMDPSFRVVMLPTMLWDRAPRWFQLFSKTLWHLLYSFVLLLDVLRRPAGDVVVYSRDPAGTLPYLLTSAPLRALKRVSFVYELHSWRNTPYYRALLKCMNGVVFITEALRQTVERDVKIPTRRCAIGRMGVNIEDYADAPLKRTLRADLGLPPNSILAMYTGKIAMQMKEIEFIVDAAQGLPDVQFVLVGGNKRAVAYWNTRRRDLNIRNVLFTGFVPPARVRDYQLAADVLLMYYPSDWGVAGVLSPGKMMEYMATGNAIVSVNHAPLTEVLKHLENALLIPPDSPAELAAAVRMLAEDAPLRERLGRRAMHDVTRYTWQNRARQLSEFIVNLRPSELDTAVSEVYEAK